MGVRIVLVLLDSCSEKMDREDRSSLYFMEIYCRDGQIFMDEVNNEENGGYFFH